VPSYAGPPVATRGEVASTLRLLGYLALTIALVILDHRGGWLSQLRAQANVVTQPLWWVAGLPGRVTTRVQDDAATRSGLIEENGRLRNDLLVANARLARLQTAAADNAQLRALLGVKTSRGLDVQLAPILDIDLAPGRQRLVLDAGSRAGATVGQSVIDAGGLMGQIIETTSAHATVLLLTDPDHAVPVVVARNGVRLIVYGRGRSDLLELADVPLNSGVEVGHDRRAAPGRQPRLPGRRRHPGRPPGPRPRRAAAEIRAATAVAAGGSEPVPAGGGADAVASSADNPEPLSRRERGWGKGQRRAQCFRPAGRFRARDGFFASPAHRERPAPHPNPRPGGRGAESAGFDPSGHATAAGAAAMSRARTGWLMPLSILVALLLGLLPLPDMLQPLRPYWLALIVAYWVIEAPDSAGLGFAVGIGLIADLMFGTLLGEQALRLLIMAFILQRFRARLRFFPMSQQALAIGGLLLNDRIVTTVVHLALGEPTLPWQYWWAPLLGMLFWPPLFVLMDALRLGRRRRG
jgi:rod shape-determining protein MreD/rod shape-determining protein MreC